MALTDQFRKPHPELPAGFTCVDWEPLTPGKKRCRHIEPNGACALASRTWCEEWLKVNPAPASAPAGTPLPRSLPQAPAVPLAVPATRPAGEMLPDAPPTPADAAARHQEPARFGTHEFSLTSPDPDAPPPADLEPAPALHTSAASPPAPRTAPAAPVRIPPRGTSLLPLPVEGPGFRPAKEIDTADLAALSKRFVEIELHSPSFGTLYLVPEYSSPPADRLELSLADAATLRLLVDAMPGAHVTNFIRRPHT